MPDEIENEIEAARRQLKEDLEKKEKEAQASIDKILAREGMEFCSRCNRKIDDRSEWAGRCLHAVCTNLICDSCWISEKKRYCREHYEEIVGPEPEAKKKVFFKPEEQKSPETQPEAEDEKEKIAILLENYIGLMRDRLAAWPPDWSPAGYIQNPKAKCSKSATGAEITIYSKRFLSKKDKIKFIIKPVYGRKQEDIDIVLSSIKDETHIYHILVLVGSECDATSLEYIDHFNKPNASLFLVEPAKHLIFMDEKPATKLYSTWLNSAKSPERLKSILKDLVKEKVSGRDIITIRSVSEKFGLSEQNTLPFLKSCKFLKHVDETDTFYFIG